MSTKNVHSYTTADGLEWGLAPGSLAVGDVVWFRNRDGEDIRCEVVSLDHPFNRNKVNDLTIELRPLDGGDTYGRFQSLVHLRKA